MFEMYLVFKIIFAIADEQFDLQVALYVRTVIWGEKNSHNFTIIALLFVAKRL